MYSKSHFIRKILSESGVERPRVLELGCGSAQHVVPILREHPGITYVGIEPFLPSYERALRELEGLSSAKVIHQLGYDTLSGIDLGSFDIVFSLSVLEHVKHLDTFIRCGASYAKPGALIVHRYDLGHALLSSSPKERFQVYLGNTFPSLLPEHKFVRYVPEVEVCTLLTHVGCDVIRATYHEMAGQKALNASLTKSVKLTEAMETLLEWEYTHADAFLDLDQKVRERLFPSVAVWSRKR